MTNLFGGSTKAIEGGNPDSNTLISDSTTVLCLDDYHRHDREGRKQAKVTALALTAQNFGERRAGRGEGSALSCPYSRRPAAQT